MTGVSVKPHGTFAPQPQFGAYILREPKGDPDILLFCTPKTESVVLTTANILSVQGYTARVVVISNISVFLAQPRKYRDAVFSDALSLRIGLWNGDIKDIEPILHPICLPEETPVSEFAKQATALLQKHL